MGSCLQVQKTLSPATVLDALRNLRAPLLPYTDRLFAFVSAPSPTRKRSALVAGLEQQVRDDFDYLWYTLHSLSDLHKRKQPAPMVILGFTTLLLYMYCAQAGQGCEDIGLHTRRAKRARCIQGRRLRAKRKASSGQDTHTDTDKTTHRRQVRLSEVHTAGTYAPPIWHRLPQRSRCKASIACNVPDLLGEP